MQRPGGDVGAARASPWRASAMSVDMTVHFDPKFLCRLTTMLPMVAGAEPAFVTLTKPIAHNCFGPFAPLAEVMVQLTFNQPLREPEH